jgi:adenylate cyclase
MALEMLASVRDLNSDSGIDLRVRIGLNTGPVVAGVIGRKKFTYDLWGSAVNLASRMQSHGLPNHIHLSEGTRRLLRDHFKVTARGTVHCKGLGEVRSYLLDGKKG